MTVDEFDSQVKPHLLFRDQGRNSDMECVSVGQAAKFKVRSTAPLVLCVCRGGRLVGSIEKTATGGWEAHQAWRRPPVRLNRFSQQVAMPADL
jgi:hypothetical protein